MSRDPLVPQITKPTPTVSEETIEAYGITWRPDPEPGYEGRYKGILRKNGVEIELFFVIPPNMESRPELVGDHTNPMNTTKRFIVNQNQFYAYNREFTDSNNIRWKILGRGNFNIVYDTTLLEDKTLGNVTYPAGEHLVYRIPLETYIPLLLAPEDVRTVAKINSAKRTVRLLNEIRTKTNAEARYPLATLYDSGLIAPFFEGNNIQDPILLRDKTLELGVRTGRDLFDSISGNIKDNGLVHDASFALRGGSPDSEAFLLTNPLLYSEWFYKNSTKQKYFPTIQINRAMAFLSFKCPNSNIDHRQFKLLEGNERVVTALAAAHDNPEILSRAKVEDYFNPNSQRSSEEEECARRDLAPDELMAKIELRNKIIAENKYSYDQFTELNTMIFRTLTDRRVKLILNLVDHWELTHLDALNIVRKWYSAWLTDICQLSNDSLGMLKPLIIQFIHHNIHRDTIGQYTQKLAKLSLESDENQFPNIMDFLRNVFNLITDSTLLSEFLDALNLPTIQHTMSRLLFFAIKNISPRVAQYSLECPVSSETFTFVTDQIDGANANGKFTLTAFTYLMSIFNFPENIAREAIKNMASKHVRWVVNCATTNIKKEIDEVRSHFLTFLANPNSAFPNAVQIFAANQLHKRNDAASFAVVCTAGLIPNRPPTSSNNRPQPSSLPQIVLRV